MDADVAGDLSNRTAAVEDESYRLLLVLRRKCTACRTHFSLSRKIRAAKPGVHRSGNGSGRKTQLTYIVREFVPGARIRLRGENKTLTAVDTMTFRSVEAGTEVTYTAEFTFKGPARLLAPLLRPAFERLGRQAQNGMHNALNQL